MIPAAINNLHRWLCLKLRHPVIRYTEFDARRRPSTTLTGFYCKRCDRYWPVPKENQ